MPSPARAQQERSREVQRRILDAAVEVLVVEGYAGATTLRIQALAGVSRGRLLHHFPSRDALLVAAAHHLATERLSEARDAVPWPDDRDARIARAIEVIALSYGQPFFWATTELWVAARTHDDLAEALLPGEQRLGAVIRADSAAFFGAEIAAHPMFPLVRDVLHTSLRGIALTTAFDHRPQTMASHVDKLVALARHVLSTPEKEAHAC